MEALGHNIYVCVTINPLCYHFPLFWFRIQRFSTGSYILRPSYPSDLYRVVYFKLLYLMNLFIYIFIYLQAVRYTPPLQYSESSDIYNKIYYYNFLLYEGTLVH